MNRKMTFAAVATLVASALFSTSVDSRSLKWARKGDA